MERKQMPDILEVIIRTVTAFLLLWLFIQILGKQTIGQTTYHLFIASITLGTLAGNLAFNIKIKFEYFILSFLLMSGIAYLLTIVALKSRKCRKWIIGEPVMIIENGKILEENMRKVKYTLDTLTYGLREKDVYNIEEVENAVLEINGTISVLKKAAYRNLTKKDLSIAAPSHEMHPIELIMDGIILEENLTQRNLSKAWLKDELTQRGLNDEDVFFAVMGTNGYLYFDLYEDHKDLPL
jgi:uncharacterized membrane protein YcaP (DUF421 family)